MQKPQELITVDLEKLSAFIVQDTFDKHLQGTPDYEKYVTDKDGNVQYTLYYAQQFAILQELWKSFIKDFEVPVQN